MTERKASRAVAFGVAAALTGVLLLSGCGRKGDPEFPPAEAQQETSAQEGAGTQQGKPESE